MKKVYVYVHVCVLNNYQEVLINILNHIYDSGLYDRLNKLRLSIVGNSVEFKNWFDTLTYDTTKIQLIFPTTRINTFEFHTLHNLFIDAISEDFYCLYLHTKGVSKQTNPNIKDWVDYLLYFTVDKFQNCLLELENFDTVGVNLTGDSENMKSNPALWGYVVKGESVSRTPQHYSGNFWWSKSDNIRKLPDPLYYASYEQYERYRVACECWICLNPNLKPKCLFQSGVNHYGTRYPKEMYVK